MYNLQRLIQNVKIKKRNQNNINVRLLCYWHKIPHNKKKEEKKRKLLIKSKKCYSLTSFPFCD